MKSKIIKGDCLEENVELVECFVRSDEPFTNASIISVFKKIKHRVDSSH